MIIDNDYLYQTTSLHHYIKLIINLTILLQNFKKLQHFRLDNKSNSKILDLKSKIQNTLNKRYTESCRNYELS